jgi:hypothetical protein
MVSFLIQLLESIRYNKPDSLQSLIAECRHLICLSLILILWDLISICIPCFVLINWIYNCCSLPLSLFALNSTIVFPCTVHPWFTMRISSSLKRLWKLRVRYGSTIHIESLFPAHSLHIYHWLHAFSNFLIGYRQIA